MKTKITSTTRRINKSQCDTNKQNLEKKIEGVDEKMPNIIYVRDYLHGSKKT